MGGSLRPSTRMTLLSAVCEALPEVAAVGSGSRDGCAGLPSLLDLVLRAIAAAGAPGALLLLKLPSVLARATKLRATQASALPVRRGVLG